MAGHFNIGRFLVFALMVSVSVGSAAQLSSPVTYFIEDGKGVPGFDSMDRDLAEMALAAWARESGGRLKFVKAAQVNDALLRVRWISAADGL